MPGFDPANPAGLFRRDQSHGYLSPHLQVSFPVTDRTNFRLSYSHQVQAPDFALLLGGINIDLAVTNSNQVYGSDLDFGKTIAFEFGIRHAFSDDMVLDVAAYNKDIISDPAARLVTLYDPTEGRDNDFRLLTNLDFGNVRGIDVRLDRRFGNYFNGTIAYAYQQAKNTGSDPFTYTNYGSRIVNQVGGNNGVQVPPQGILPTDDSRPHALTGAFSITLPSDFRQGTVMGDILRNVSVFSTFRYTSGTAYTKCGESNEEQSILSIENCNRLFPEGLNTQRLPAFKELNARFTKSFALGGLDMTGYLDVRNLLNFRNVLQVFAVNGDVKNDRERDAHLLADLNDLASERDLNDAVGPNGAMRLPTAHQDCSTWLSTKNAPAAANCLYLIRAEQRFGDGDHIFTVDEQTDAINALYDVARGEQQMLGVGRRARLGFEVNF
jgi:outer membrane receptor protein involved in Fe transport